MSVQAACREAPNVDDERRAGAERTSNMRGMYLTRDVLKLSGWLYACALCRVQREAG